MIYILYTHVHKAINYNIPQPYNIISHEYCLLRQYDNKYHNPTPTWRVEVLIKIILPAARLTLYWLPVRAIGYNMLAIYIMELLSLQFMNGIYIIIMAHWIVCYLYGLGLSYNMDGLKDNNMGLISIQLSAA